MRDIINKINSLNQADVYHGITELYLANKFELSDFISSSGIVSTIKMVEGSKFKQIEFENKTGFFTNEMRTKNGQRCVFHCISFQTKNQIEIGNYVGIVKGNNNRYFILGLENGLDLTKEENTNGLTFYLSGLEPKFAYEVDSLIPV